MTQPATTDHLGALLPRAAAIVAWLREHQAEIEAIDFGQIVIDWSPTATKVKVTQSDIIRPACQTRSLPL